ncbi:MAG: hypothetical protein ACI4FO_05915 [Acutalibacteraceae bacterium]
MLKQSLDLEVGVLFFCVAVSVMLNADSAVKNSYLPDDKSDNINI